MRISDWSSDVCSSDLIWQQLLHEASHEDDVEAAKAELEAEREDYRAIAVRRVRLGLLLSEIGQANDVQISQQEMSRLIAQAAKQYRPEDQKKLFEDVQQDKSDARRVGNEGVSTCTSRGGADQ